MNHEEILVIEDDHAIQNLITTTLETQQYKFKAVTTGAQAMTEVVSKHFDVILLDLGLPDMDGVNIIKKVRTWSNVPIIVVSARTEDKDKIDALDAGADDYLTKPFSVDELLARLRVAIRRAGYYKEADRNENKIFENGGLKIDYTSGCAYMNGDEMHLTPIEYKLLCLLSQNVGRVLTHQFILKEIWNSPLESDITSLRVFMATLRKKIEKNPAQPQYIQTHVGIGYRMLKVE